ncbi:MAG: site-specific recombinase XerD, partial [Rhodothermales bacterium]
MELIIGSSLSSLSPERTHSRTEAEADAAKAQQGQSWEAELQALEAEIQQRNYSRNTLKAYRRWTKKFQTFTHSKTPRGLTTGDVKAFLSDLAVSQKVSASAQNQAFNSLLFFFRYVLKREFGKVEGVVRAKQRRYIPVVLSPREVQAVLAEIAPPHDLVVKFLYGCGLRISECLSLRVKCLNLDMGVLTIHDGKGGVDRTLPLPQSIMPEIEGQLRFLRELHTQDLA